MSFVEMAVELYSEVIAVAVPIAAVFEVGNLIVSTFMRVAFGGRLWFGSR